MIGLFLGYLVGGPAAAVFGVLIGNIFDIGLNNALHSPQWHYYRRASVETKSFFLTTLFQIMGHIAKTDGRVMDCDIAIARKIMQEMRLFGADKRRAMQFYNDGKAPYFQFEKHLRALRQLCYYNKDLLALFAETQYRAAQHNSPVSGAKKDKLNDVFLLLGFKAVFPERIQARQYDEERARHEKAYRTKTKQERARYHDKPNYGHNRARPLSDYEILGVQQGARAALVKKAYRKKMSQIHPDKLIARGASQQEIDAATDKAQEIQAAYERIKKFRGF